ncbi:MAG TPA: hypothetical protein VJC18_02240, partial [bacterium]|nr:hypothetical protein [bacterium]
MSQDGTNLKIDRLVAFLICGEEFLDVLEQIYLLCRYLSGPNNIHVILPPHLKNAGIGFYEKIKSTKATVHVLHATNVASFASRREIKKIVRSHQIRLLHTYDVVAAQAVAKINLRKIACEHIMTVTDHNPYLLASGFKGRGLRKVLAQASQTIFTSHHAQEKLVARV